MFAIEGASLVIYQDPDDLNPLFNILVLISGTIPMPGNGENLGGGCLVLCLV